MRHPDEPVPARLLAAGCLLLLSLHSAAAPPARADATMVAVVPITDTAEGRWDFVGDHVVHTTIRSSPLFTGAFESFSFENGKSLWRGETALGAIADLSSHTIARPGPGMLCVGTGPVSLIDTETGARRWTLDFDHVGLVDMQSTTLLPGGRLLLLGTRAEGSFEKALDNPQVMLVDANTGKVIWTHPVKPYKYDVALGFWKRLQAYDNLNPGAAKKEKYQLAIYAVGHGEGGAVVSTGTDADQVLVVGEKLQALSLADGHELWIAPEKTGIVRNVSGHVAYMRHLDELSGYDIGSGRKLWTMDLQNKGATIYAADDLEDKNMHGPKDMDFVLVSEKTQVSRVDPATGKAVWSARREDSNWQPTEAALLVEGKSSTTAYDWTTGAKRWEFSGGRLPHAYGDGPTLLFVERGEKKNGQFVGPFKFWAVNGADGRVIWNRDDLNGRKILGWSMTDAGQVRLVPDKGDVALFSLETGELTAPPETADISKRRFVYYSRDEKMLSCSDYAGKRVWERRAEMSSDFHYKLIHDQIVWADKDGNVEVIDLGDGGTHWKGQAAFRNPRVFLDDARTRMVVQTKEGAAFVKL